MTGDGERARTDQREVTISVHGNARRVVSPDYAIVQSAIKTKRDSKVDALRAASSARESLVGVLASLGGVVLTADTERAQLTWSTQTATTHDEHDFDAAAGQHGPTGRTIAVVAVVIGTRDFALLEHVGTALAAEPDIAIHSVSWLVDQDNPAWPDVRAAAIDAALEKGRHYATALGGSVVRIEHVADAGLLGGEGEPGGRVLSARPLAWSASFSGDGPDVPSLDPVPQELFATIEARLVASVPGEVTTG